MTSQSRCLKANQSCFSRVARSSRGKSLFQSATLAEHRVRGIIVSEQPLVPHTTADPSRHCRLDAVLSLSLSCRLGREADALEQVDQFKPAEELAGGSADNGELPADRTLGTLELDDHSDRSWIDHALMFARAAGLGIGMYRGLVRLGYLRFVAHQRQHCDLRWCPPR
jgi:hypothetical protein